MRSTSTSSGLLAFAATASAAYQGMNYASTNYDGSVRSKTDFETYFKTQANLIGTSGFNSARLYTMIQAGTTDTPIEAIDAAIATNTTLLFGLWTSGDPSGFTNELNALKNAITTYGDKLPAVVAGISVGSEDLYRNSPTGIAAKSGVGIGPGQLTNYIKQVKTAVAGTSLSSSPIGHVDTWTAWANSSNSAVADECDFIGLDAYPYFQNSMSNAVEDGKALIDSAISQVEAAVGDTPIWITETGWPTVGDKQNLAVASAENAEKYWQAVGCPLFGKSNVWWYILEDAGQTPSFGVVSDPSSTTPLYNLTCTAAQSSSSSTSSTTSSSGSKQTSSSNTSSGSSNGTSSGSSNGTQSGNTTSTGSSSGSSTTGVTTVLSSPSSSASASSTTGVAGSGGAMNTISFSATFLALVMSVLAL